MHPKAKELQERTRAFASRIILFCENLPRSIEARKIIEQLVDSSGSVDSNYRATCRARSLKEFIAKVGVAAEEADESKGWLLLLVQSKLATIEATRDLIQEADELTAIFVKSRKTAERRQRSQGQLKKQGVAQKPINPQ